MPKKTSDYIWAEKYRPERLDEIVGQPFVIRKLKAFVERGIPHMLFAGSPGIGKTTAALCIAREMYGNKWSSNFLELNASDERGIDVVRNKIKSFARTRAINANYKIICLDEADSLTTDAQHALRRTMEKYTSSTRFILICNYSSKIIDPIQSRCAVFRFKPLTKEQSIEYLEKIGVEENLKIDKSAFDAVLYLAEGDMRRAINLLQAAATMPDITEKTIYDISAAAQPETVKKMINSALKADFSSSRALLLELLKEGIAGEDIIKEIGKQIYDLAMPDKKRILLVEKIGEFEYRISSGGNTQIQLEALLAQFAAL